MIGQFFLEEAEYHQKLKAKGQPTTHANGDLKITCCEIHGQFTIYFSDLQTSVTQIMVIH